MTRTGASRIRILVALFAVYLALLTWMVVFRFELPWAIAQTGRQVKLVPFVAGDGYGASAPWEVLANLVIFVPFGLYLGVLRPSWRWWKAACAFAVASLALEGAQYALAAGMQVSSEINLGTRTILEYVLSPVQKAWHEAGRER